VSATPLQMALVAAAVGSRGVMLAPRIVKRITTGRGKELIYTGVPLEVGRAVSEETAARITSLMEEVMQSGTGRAVKKIYFEDGRFTTSPANANGSAVSVAGKTGTAEVGDRNSNGTIDPDEKPHSWFIGFAPAREPRVAIAVIAENQGFGSLTAAPIAMDVLAEALNQGEGQEAASAGPMSHASILHQPFY
jgi:penicillin-binding protein A